MSTDRAAGEVTDAGSASATATVTVRELVQGDAERVIQLDRLITGADRSATWDQYVGRLLSIIALDSFEYPPWGCFVAECGNEIIGFLMAERQTQAYGLPPGVRIVAIAVHPDYRRRGVGAQLVEALCDRARAEGIDDVFSVLPEEDERDSAFLERQGFKAAQFKVLTRSA